MNFFVENLPYILAGISVGGQYALIAIGYTMVYGILRLINFAHGDMFMVAGLVMVYIAASVPIYIAIPIVIIFTVILGCTIEVVAYRPLRSAPRMSVMISAIGVSYLLQNTALYVTGGLTQTYPTIPWLAKTVTIMGAHTKMVTLITPVLTILLVIGLVLLPQLRMPPLSQSPANQPLDQVIENREHGDADHHTHNAPHAAKENNGKHDPEAGQARPVPQDPGADHVAVNLLQDL